MSSLRVRAFAKLTLSLRVLGVRADGFHELDALTVSLNAPHDALAISLLDHDATEIELTGPGAAGVSADEDNLATRAARLLLARASGVGARISLHKQIPAGAGLGGGSADAAAVLVGLDHLLQLGLPAVELAALGATLGSDVPFCVSGGAARMRGRGERIEPATIPALHVLVAVPPFAISTPAVYRAWDDLGGPIASRVVHAPAGVGGLTNDLEAAAELVEPRLAPFRDGLEIAAGAPAILAGSGSSCAVLSDDPAAAAAACERVVAARIAALCVVGVTRSSGVELVPEAP